MQKQKVVRQGSLLQYKRPGRIGYYILNVIMKKWRRLNFSRQIAIVYAAIVAVLVISILVFTGFYLSGVVEDKIMEFSENALHQSSMNISTTLQGYQSYLTPMIVDTQFLDMLDRYDLAGEEEEQEPRIAFRNAVKTFFTYQLQVRCLSIETEGGKLFGLDRLEIDSIYQKPVRLHEDYFKNNTQESGKRQSCWLATEFLDRQGTRDYYLFTLNMPIYNWYDNRYAGNLLMSVDESVLAQICEEAEISDAHEMLIIDCKDTIISHKESSNIKESAAKLWENPDNIVRMETIAGTDWRLVSVLERSYIFGQLKKFYVLLLLLAVSVSGLAMTMTIYMSRQLSQSVKNIVSAMETVQVGKLSAQVDVDVRDKNEMTKIAAHFNSMMERINEQVEQVKEAGRKEKEAELKALEAQINPHFIYNTLDSINWMAIENQETEISQMLNEFAQILRYQIKKSTKIVTIREELSYLELYLHLQKVRFSDAFEYILDFEGNTGNCMIYKMLFQPFVENAIVHSFVNLDHGGLLKILVENADEKQLCFIISDNGTGMPPDLIHKLFFKKEAVSRSIGVPNVLARLDAYYGSEYRLEVTSIEREGTVIKIWIPKITGQLKEKTDEDSGCRG